MSYREASFNKSVILHVVIFIVFGVFFQIDLEYVCAIPSLLYPDPTMASETPENNTLFKVDVKYGTIGNTRQLVTFKVRL